MSGAATRNSCDADALPSIPAETLNPRGNQEENTRVRRRKAHSYGSNLLVHPAALGRARVLPATAARPGPINNRNVLLS